MKPFIAISFLADQSPRERSRSATNPPPYPGGYTNTASNEPYRRPALP